MNGRTAMTAPRLLAGLVVFMAAQAASGAGPLAAPPRAGLADVPQIFALPAYLVQGTTAYLDGKLVAGSNSNVRVYWGTTDAGPSPNGWSRSMDLGVFNPRDLTCYATSLISDTNYYYRYFATNAYGSSWSAAEQFKPHRLTFPDNAKITDFTQPGAYSYVVPAGTVKIIAVCIGGGGGGRAGSGGANGGGGGGLRYGTDLPVTPGETLSVVVGSGAKDDGIPGNDSYIQRNGVDILRAGGGGKARQYQWNNGGGGGGTPLGGNIGGGDGGNGGYWGNSIVMAGGGGAGGYSGGGHVTRLNSVVNNGIGAYDDVPNGMSGIGGGGGGGAQGSPGGGVGLNGEGISGGGGGGGGSSGTAGTAQNGGGLYGGGGGGKYIDPGGGGNSPNQFGGNGAVRIAATSDALPDDLDKDGLRDAWENAHGGIILFSRNGDFDGDGMTDGDEYIAGTDPDNREEVLKLLIWNTNGATSVKFTVMPTTNAFTPGTNRYYSLLSAAVPGTGWVGVANYTNFQNPLDIPLPVEYTDDGALKTRFFRVRAWLR